MLISTYARHLKRHAGLMLASLVLMSAGLQAAAPATEVTLHVRQATDMSVTPGGDGRLITDIGGRLWTLPDTGGSATPLPGPSGYARRPRLSPDGRTLAFEGLHEGALQVMLMDVGGGNVRAVTSGAARHLAPAWSPDGRRLALATDRSGRFAIWELTLETGSLRQITFEPGEQFDPAWAPTDGALAYINVLDGRSVLVVRSPGTAPRTIHSSAYPLHTPAWRPDGTVISFVAGLPQGPRLNMAILSSPVIIKPAAGSESAIAAPAHWLDRNRLLYTADGAIRVREIGALGNTELPFDAALTLNRVSEPPAHRLAEMAGTRQARSIAGIAPLSDGNLVVAALGDLWEVDARGTPRRQLTRDAFVDRNPAVSGDGRMLAFSSDRSGSAQIWLLELATGQRRVLSSENMAASHPAWNAAGDRMAYLVAEAGGSFGLKVTDVQTGQATAAGAGLLDPGTPAWSPDDSHIGVIENRQGNPQLLLFGLDGRPPHRITLPGAVAGPGVNEAQWSTDGGVLLVASAAGLRQLPARANGQVSADWRSLSDHPVQFARWADSEALFVTDTEGLARINTRGDGTPERIALDIGWQPVAVSGRTIVRASRIFDGRSEGYLYDHDIIIEGKRIVAIQPWATDSAGAAVVDARGKTVIPGLIDLALRLDQGAGERLGRTLLAYGITTVQATSGNDAGLRAVAEHWQTYSTGPRLLRASAWCGQPAGRINTVASDGYSVLDICPAMLAALPQLAGPLQLSGSPVWTSSWLGALTGLVHVISPGVALPASTLTDTGQVNGGYYQDAIDVMARSGVVLAPALAARGLPYLADEQPDLLAGLQYERLFTAEEQASQARIWLDTRHRQGAAGRTGLRLRQRALGRLVAAGGQLAAASHSPSVPYGLGLHAEIRLLAGTGLSPARALGMATATAARALGLQDETGTLAAGLRADLLIIDGDPLRDLSHLLRIERIMTDGTQRLLTDLLPTPPTLENFTTTPPPKRTKAGPESR